MVRKAGLGGNLLDAEGGVLQQLLGGIDPPLIQIFIRCHAVGAAEAADGLGYGKIGDLAAFFQR